VLSNWKNGGYFYPGKIIDVKEGKYEIHYDFSYQELVEEKDFVLRNVPKQSDLDVNMKVYVQIDQNPDRWVPAIIKEMESNNYLVTYTHNNNSYDKRVPLQKLVR
jgi:hypothetical protein